MAGEFSFLTRKSHFFYVPAKKNPQILAAWESWLMFPGTLLCFENIPFLPGVTDALAYSETLW